jgi:hypothetical protein
VYRNEQGGLVMFDDYASYGVASDLGIEWVEVQILGERDSSKRGHRTTPTRR